MAEAADWSDRPLVIRLFTPAGAVRKFALISAALAALAVAELVLAFSWGNALIAGVLLLIFGFIWARWLVLGHRYASRTELVVTRAGLSSQLWSVGWQDVERARMQYIPASKTRLLRLDLRCRPTLEPGLSLPVRLVMFPDRFVRKPSIRIQEINVDTRLEELLAELEARAGRPLLERIS